MNKCIFVGRNVRPIELKGNEKPYCKFSIAVPRKGNSEETDFIDCTAFGKTAEFMSRNVRKGAKILVQGKLQISSYEDNEGNKRRSFGIIVDEIEIMEWGELEAEKPMTPSPKKKPTLEPLDDDEMDDIPF